MRTQCPNKCHLRPNAGKVNKFGFFYRTSDRRKIQRYKCAHCGKYFSQATFSVNFGLNKRHIHKEILEKHASGVSQRRMAKLLKVHPITIARKLTHLGSLTRYKNLLDRLKRQNNKIQVLQFDDLETFEHTKMKPLSVTMAVEKGSRYIVGFEVARMPAKGRLAKKSLKKYGPRVDERKEARERLFRRIQSVVNDFAIIGSDNNPHYPNSVKKYFPNATHIGYPGLRGSITGQGELKKSAFDPLFSLNHTYAMLRANINRLFRKTWNTTKKIQALRDHLELYVWYHNNELLKKSV